MLRRSNDVKAMSEHAWGNAYTRSLLGVRLGLGDSGNWSMVKAFASPPPVEIGDRAPDGVVQDSAGRAQSDCTICSAARSSRSISPTRGVARTFRRTSTPWLTHYVVSRWDPPRDVAASATARCSTSAIDSPTATAVRPTPWCWSAPTTTSPRSSRCRRASRRPRTVRRSACRTGRRSRRDDLGLLPLRRRGHSDDRCRQRHWCSTRPALRARRRHRDRGRPAPRSSARQARRTGAQPHRPAQRSTFRTKPPSLR